MSLGGREQQDEQGRAGELLRGLEHQDLPADRLAPPTGKAIVDRRADAGADQQGQGGVEIEDTRPHHRHGEGARHGGGLGDGREHEAQDQQDGDVLALGQEASPRQPDAQRTARQVQHLHAQEQQAHAQKHKHGVAQTLGEPEIEVEDGAGDPQGAGHGGARLQRDDDHQSRRAHLGPDRQQHRPAFRHDPRAHQADHHQRHRAGALADQAGDHARQGHCPACPDRTAEQPASGRAGERGQIGCDEAHAAEEQAQPRQQGRKNARGGQRRTLLPRPLNRPTRIALRRAPPPPIRRPPSG